MYFTFARRKCKFVGESPAGHDGDGRNPRRIARKRPYPALQQVKGSQPERPKANTSDGPEKDSLDCTRATCRAFFTVGLFSNDRSHDRCGVHGAGYGCRGRERPYGQQGSKDGGEERRSQSIHS